MFARFVAEEFCLCAKMRAIFARDAMNPKINKQLSNSYVSFNAGLFEYSRGRQI